jgi:hypothetical protein
MRGISAIWVTLIQRSPNWSRKGAGPALEARPADRSDQNEPSGPVPEPGGDSPFLGWIDKMLSR